MDFIKKHYEKLILSLVLLGLVGASAMMYFSISSVEEVIQETERALVTQVKPAEFKPLDLGTNETVIEKLRNPQKIVFTGTNNLFNPVKWLRKGDGTIIKLSSGNEVGPAAVSVLKLTPLHLIVSYDGTNSGGDTLRYQFNLTREAEKNVNKRRKTPVFLTAGSKQEGLLLKEVMGPKEDPTGFVLVWLEDNSTIQLTKGKEFSRVAGYSADLQYAPENINRIGLRREDKLTFGGETYNIVAITDRDVTLSAKSNGKNTTVQLRGNP